MPSVQPAPENRQIAAAKFAGGELSLPIRVAGPRDRAAILELLHLQHDEAPIAEPDWVKIGHAVDAALRGDGGFAAVCLEGDRVVGSAGAFVAQLWWTREWHVSEHWFFVHPEHRKSRHAARLALFLKARAAQLSLPLVSSVFSTKDTERKVRFFSRHFRQIGALFLTRPGD